MPTNETLRFGGKRLLQLDPARAFEPLPPSNTPEVDWEKLFDALKLTPDERKALESTLESSLPEAAERLGWTVVKLRNSLDRARRRVAKGNLRGQQDRFVKTGSASRRSLNPIHQSRSGLTWNLAPLNATTQNMRQDTLGILVNVPALLREMILDLQVIMLGATAGSSQTGGGGVTLAQIQLLSDATRNSNITAETSAMSLQATVTQSGNAIVAAIQAEAALLDTTKIVDKLTAFQGSMITTIQELGKSIDKSLNPLGMIGTVLSTLGTVGSAIGGLGSAVGGVGSALGSVGTAVSSIGGGVLSSISGVIGDIQNNVMHDDLKSIELNTRLTAIAMLGNWTKADPETMFAFTKRTTMAVEDMQHFNWTVLHSDLVGIWGGITDVLNAVKAGGGAAPTSTAVDFTALFEILRVELLNVQNGIVAAVADVKATLFGQIHSDLVGIWGSIDRTGSVIATALSAIGALLSAGQPPSSTARSVAVPAVPTINVSAPASAPATTVALSSAAPVVSVSLDPITAALKSLTDLTATFSVKFDQIATAASALSSIAASGFGAVVSAITLLSGRPAPAVNAPVALSAPQTTAVAMSESAAPVNPPTFSADAITAALNNLGNIETAGFGRLSAAVKEIPTVDWTMLREDLAGIWSGAIDIKNAVVALPSQFAASLAAVPQPKFAIFLDGRELTQSIVTNLSQSGTIVPQAA